MQTELPAPLVPGDIIVGATVPGLDGSDEATLLVLNGSSFAVKGSLSSSLASYCSPRLVYNAGFFAISPDNTQIMTTCQPPAPPPTAPTTAQQTGLPASFVVAINTTANFSSSLFTSFAANSTTYATNVIFMPSGDLLVTTLQETATGVYDNIALQFNVTNASIEATYNMSRILAYPATVLDLTPSSDTLLYTEASPNLLSFNLAGNTS